VLSLEIHVVTLLDESVHTGLDVVNLTLGFLTLEAESGELTVDLDASHLGLFADVVIIESPVGQKVAW